MTTVDFDERNTLLRIARATGIIVDLESPSTVSDDPYRIVYPNGCGQVCRNLDDLDKYLPNPFTDANDDYAVLEWMRKDGTINVNFVEQKQYHYRIGDYARFAIKFLLK